jgi:hypothetical protein
MHDLEAGPKGEEKAITSPASPGSDVDEAGPIMSMLSKTQAMGWKRVVGTMWGYLPAVMLQ